MPAVHSGPPGDPSQLNGCECKAANAGRGGRRVVLTRKAVREKRQLWATANDRLSRRVIASVRAVRRPMRFCFLLQRYLHFAVSDSIGRVYRVCWHHCWWRLSLASADNDGCRCFVAESRLKRIERTAEISRYIQVYSFSTSAVGSTSMRNNQY